MQAGCDRTGWGGGGARHPTRMHNYAIPFRGHNASRCRSHHIFDVVCARGLMVCLRRRLRLVVLAPMIPPSR